MDDVAENGAVPQGVTLRDWFAGLALQGLVTNQHLSNEQLAVVAYTLADEMLKVRKLASG